MITIVLNIGLILLSFFCLTDKDDNAEKKGIIENRPKIEINKSTQIDLDFSKIVCQNLDTAVVFSDNICDSLLKHLNIIKQRGNYKGLSIAIGVPDKGFWKASIGESGTKVPLNTETKFHALSLGKIFTSALILKLAEDGYLNLNDTIIRWFPDCPRANEITIDHLLCHTSGIQTYEALYEFVLNDKNSFSEEELIDMAFKYDIPDVPDSYFSYSNTGYVMLGIIISQVTGITLNENFIGYFIKPLGLKNTVFCDGENLNMVNIRGFTGEKVTKNNRWPLTYATGPLISTPTDIIILYNYLLSGQFLSKSSMDRMFAEMNIWKYYPDTYYGKGIFVIKDLPSGNYLGHSGGYANFRTCVFYNIENSVFVSIFSNSDAFEIEPAMFSMSEKIVKLVVSEPRPVIRSIEKISY